LLKLTNPTKLLQIEFADACLVLDGKRQVFFSTANARVANLFARKFDFLGQSFKEIRLERSDR
jgi:hypothetical protein